MAIIDKYPGGSLYLTDYLIGIDRSTENVTRNMPVSDIVYSILAAKNIGTVTSIATSDSTYINLEGGPITITGSLKPSLSATGLGGGFTLGTPEYNAYIQTQFLRGDNTWSQPGPNPTKITVKYNGGDLTTDVTSIKFQGAGVTAADTNNNVTVIVPGLVSVVDSVIAGGGISTNQSIGVVEISNAGVWKARAGGNITLSGTTGNVTVNSTANSGTVTSVTGGTGIDVVTNSTSNAEIDVDVTTANNYINANVGATEVLSLNDQLPFNQIVDSGGATSGNVKTVRAREITEDMLTLVKAFIDAADKGKVKNEESPNYITTAKAKYMVTLTQSEYNALPSKDPNTLYFIAGAGTTYTVDLARDTTGLTVNGGSYSLTPALPQSFTGITGTTWSFTTDINVTSGSYVPGNMPLTTTGTVGSSNSTETHVITGTVNPPPGNSGRAELQIPGGNITGNMASTYSTVWEYASGAPTIYDPPAGYSAGNSLSYTFNTTRVDIKAAQASTYRWSSGSPTYDGVYPGVGGNSNYQGTVNFTSASQTVPVQHSIYGDIEIIPYQASMELFVHGDSNYSTHGSTTITNSGTIPTITATVQETAPSTGTPSNPSVILNLSNGAGFTWNNVSTNLDGSGFTDGTGNYKWQAGSPTFNDHDTGAAVTYPFSSSISGANYNKKVNINGVIEFTPAATTEYRQLDALTAAGAITYTNAATATGATTPTIADVIITQSPTNCGWPTCTEGIQRISGNTGVGFTYGTITVTSEPGTIFSTPAAFPQGNPLTGNYGDAAASGTGTSSADPKIETYSITGVLKRMIVDLGFNYSIGYEGSSNITWNVTWEALGTGGSIMQWQSASTGGPTTLSIPNYGIGSFVSVRANVRRTAPDNSTAYDGYIYWQVNGVNKYTQSWVAGTTVPGSGYTQTFTSSDFSDGDTLTVFLREI